MINFRFHIVSLTAVLLALGVGLVLGTAFLDDALVNTLRGQLDGLESDLDHERARVSEQRRELSDLESEYDSLDEALGERMLAGRLEGSPVLLITDGGVNGDLVQRAREMLAEADAWDVGTWELTDRFALDDEASVEELAEALGLSMDNPERLRDNVLDQLGDVLYGVTDAAESADPDLAGLLRQDEGELPPDEGEGEGEGEGGEEGEAEPPEPREPPLLAALHTAGFVDYQLPEDSEADVVLLPPGGLRILVLSDPMADAVPDSSLLPRILTRLTSDGPAPVVVATPGWDEADEEDEEPAARSLVNRVREDDALHGRVSTVDHVDRPAGKVALALAVEAAVPGRPHLGDYGLDADELLPPREALAQATD